jgi:hypothetical protein
MRVIVTTYHTRKSFRIPDCYGLHREVASANVSMQIVQTSKLRSQFFPIARLYVPFARDELPASITEHETLLGDYGLVFWVQL